MVLKSKLIGSCVQSDINLTQSDLRLDWNWVCQKRMVFLPTRLLSAASGPSDPWPGRTRNRHSGSDKSRGGDLRDLNTCSLALQRRVALTMAETTSGWQWQRSRQDHSTFSCYPRFLGFQQLRKGLNNNVAFFTFRPKCYLM